MSAERARIVVSGRVQGVFFRAFTEQVANMLGLTGWVRNLPDGRVEAVFEGEKASIWKAIASCHKGPPASRVDDIEIDWQEATGEFEAFRVKYF